MQLCANRLGTLNQRQRGHLRVARRSGKVLQIPGQIDQKIGLVALAHRLGDVRLLFGQLRDQVRQLGLGARGGNILLIVYPEIDRSGDHDDRQRAEQRIAVLPQPVGKVHQPIGQLIGLQFMSMIGSHALAPLSRSKPPAQVIGPS